MNLNLYLPTRKSRARLLVVVAGMVCLARAHAQPFIENTEPPNLATGVSPSAPVVFTFSEQMDTALTVALFLDSSGTMVLPTSSSWSANDTVLTCTPMPPFSANSLIFWSVNGESLIGDPLEGANVGFFTTGSGGGGTGSGTNRLTVFTLGKVHFYDQTSDAAPTLNAEAPYNFTAATTLASNRSASSVTITLPTPAVSNLVQNFLHPESFYLFASSIDLPSFNTTFPSGDYVFNVVAAASNQMVTVNLPANFVQPNAPHIANFSAAQAVDAAQPFQLSWDAFQNGNAADYISVSVGNVFKTPDPGTPGALSGVATSVLIPAGTLQASSNYDVTIGFYRTSGTSSAGYTTSAYLATTTDFALATSSGGVTGPLVFANPVRVGDVFTFDIASDIGQGFTVEWSATMATNQWQVLLATNSMTGLVRVTHAATNRYLFYRARKNP